jgi:membrane associated rhomboid family serine protease
VTEFNAHDTRVRTRPVWRTFLLLFLTSGLYRAWWVWRTNEDLALFAREREGRIGPHQAIRCNASAAAAWTALMLPGSSMLLFGLLLSAGQVPAEYGFSRPGATELAFLVVGGAILLVPGLVVQLRTVGRIRAARRLAGLEPSTRWTGRAFAPLLLLDVIAVPAVLFAMQDSVNDLWSRFPPLLDEDLHGELAREDRREAAVARRPALHEERLRAVADELDRPGLVPWVTIGFGVLCTVVFGYQLWEHGPFPGTRDIERIGGLREGLDGTWWRFWTANVLHAGVDHLTGNLVVWAFIGTLLERAVGHVRMLVLVVVGAAGCSIGALLAHPDVVGLGASGVVFAAFGMAAILDPGARRALGKLGWSLVALGLGLSTFAPGVSSGGHVGGVLAGAALGAVVALLWRVDGPVVSAADRATRRRPVIDPGAPLAPDRELSTGERLAHLDRRMRDGELDEVEHERLRRALLVRG